MVKSSISPQPPPAEHTKYPQLFLPWLLLETVFIAQCQVFSFILWATRVYGVETTFQLQSSSLFLKGNMAMRGELYIKIRSKHCCVCNMKLNARISFIFWISNPKRHFWYVPLNQTGNTFDQQRRGGLVRDRLRSSSLTATHRETPRKSLHCPRGILPMLKE